jgi:uncharacterized protein
MADRTDGRANRQPAPARSSPTPPEFEIVRDPLWDNIQLDPATVAILDTPPVQRLRYVRQLGHAFLVYPGATHSRLEHALGTYHLAGRALTVLSQRGELGQVSEAARCAFRLAALLHDIGHYPYSHALEEAGFPHHERLGVARLTQGELGHQLETLGIPGLAAEIGELMQGTSGNPLQGLISGSLDLDKIDYLSRDARACGVPYGNLDVDRLLAAMTVIDPGDGTGPRIGVLEKGISALESLLFAKYQMYRNVYWHHAVRSATCMFKRAVRSAVRAGGLARESIAQATDGSLMERLFGADPTGLGRAVHVRRLFKRALDLPASDVPEERDPWMSDDPDLVERVEDAVAREAGLEPAELLIDFPARANMLTVDLPLLTRTGSMERLTDEGRAGQLGLPRIASALYQSARRLRVFVARPAAGRVEGIAELVGLDRAEIGRRLEAGRILG